MYNNLPLTKFKEVNLFYSNCAGAIIRPHKWDHNKVGSSYHATHLPV